MKPGYLKINVRGGILPPAQLLEVSALAEQWGSTIAIGQRQNFLLEARGLAALPAFDSGLEAELGHEAHPNLMSSYVAHDLFNQDSGWLSEGAYKDLLDSIEESPRLAINITDPSQGLVPCFSGHLNFVASPLAGFWYLVLVHPHLSGRRVWPWLVHGSEAGALAACIERIWSSARSMEEQVSLVNAQRAWNARPAEPALNLPRHRFPYFEGMNRAGKDSWLGVFRRRNDFSPDFLRDMAELCLATRIGAIHLTPWRTILVKGIEEADRLAWEKLLGWHGLDTRHSATELHWQIPDLSTEAMALKDELVAKLDARETRTYGVAFTVQLQAEDPAAAFTSVILRKRDQDFDLLHKERFDPASPELRTFAANVARGDLADVLERLCRTYHRMLGEDWRPAIEKPVAQAPETWSLPAAQAEIHPCPDCKCIYSPQWGDPLSGVAPGIPFSAWPAAWACPVCGCGMEHFTGAAR